MNVIGKYMWSDSIFQRSVASTVNLLYIIPICVILLQLSFWSWKLAHVSSVQLYWMYHCWKYCFSSSVIHSVGPGQQYAWNDGLWKTVAKLAW